MAYKRKTWGQKLARARAKKDLPKRFYCEKAKCTFVVPAVADVEAAVKRVPRGRLITQGLLGDIIRRAHKADRACPIVTGIFTMLIAHAAEEASNEAGTPARGGKPRGLPWWRVLKTGGALNPRYPGGGEVQRRLLKAEGHAIVVKGKSLRVEQYEEALVEATA